MNSSSMISRDRAGHEECEVWSKWRVVLWNQLSVDSGNNRVGKQSQSPFDVSASRFTLTK